MASVETRPSDAAERHKIGINSWDTDTAGERFPWFASTTQGTQHGSKSLSLGFSTTLKMVTSVVHQGHVLFIELQHCFY